MSKGNRGNKEAKKPKQVTPAVKTPATAIATPPPASGLKPLQGKR